jgi:hypothetical protein
MLADGVVETGLGGTEYRREQQRRREDAKEEEWDDGTAKAGNFHGRFLAQEVGTEQAASADQRGATGDRRAVDVEPPR